MTSACATKGFVREQAALVDAKYDARVNATDANVTRVEGTAGEALQRAQGVEPRGRGRRFPDQPRQQRHRRLVLPLVQEARRVSRCQPLECASVATRSAVEALPRAGLPRRRQAAFSGTSR